MRIIVILICKMYFFVFDLIVVQKWLVYYYMKFCEVIVDRNYVFRVNVERSVRVYFLLKGIFIGQDMVIED